jgi:HK97 family phage portal protein
MFRWLGKTLVRTGSWLLSKSTPQSLLGSQWSGSSAIDLYHRHRNPSPNELLAELKGTAWSCASINASICATYAPNLYVITKHNQPRPKCATAPISVKKFQRLQAMKWLGPKLKSAAMVEEVTDHPLLDLLQAPTAPLNTMGPFDLWELTTLYQEVHGCAYWYLERDPLLGVPGRIWVLPSQNMTPVREANSPNLIDSFRYRSMGKEQRFAPEDIIPFRYPDPRSPYTSGLSPLRACFEQVSLTSDFAALKQAKFDNRAIPDALISPTQVIGEEERDRLERQWNAKLRQGGAGRVIVAESEMKVEVLQHSLGDLALLADIKATAEQICNAFHVPVAFMTTQTNLANLQASQAQHMAQAISPRLQRRDEKLNSTLVPLFDPSGRLFLASEDPVPVDQNAALQQLQTDLEQGILSINEVRAGRGLPPVAWGEVPWLNQRLVPTDVPRQMPGQSEAAPSVNYNATPAQDDSQEEQP